MSLPPELPASHHLDAALDPAASPQESEHPILLVLACASLLIAVAADLLTVVVLTIAILAVFERRPEPPPDSSNGYFVYATISGLLYSRAIIAAIGAAGALVLSILIRRGATRRPETSDVARIAAGGVRFSFPAVALWATILCGNLFLAVTSSPAHP